MPRELTELMEALYQLRRARSSGSEEDQSGLATRSTHCGSQPITSMLHRLRLCLSRRTRTWLDSGARVGAQHLARRGAMSVGDLVDAMDKEVLVRVDHRGG